MQAGRRYGKIRTVSEKRHIAGMSRTELSEFAVGFGQPKYRGSQLFNGVHGRRLLSFEDITDLPKLWRQELDEVAEIATFTVESRFISEDGTRRFLLKTRDGYPVESVFIPSDGRDTICFSSQSGCALKCDFCLTAKLGLLRNLTAGEIVEQVIIVLNDVYGIGGETPHGTNLVAMGAGRAFHEFR